MLTCSLRRMIMWAAMSEMDTYKQFEPPSAAPAEDSAWQARLQLGFSLDEGVTRLTDRRHLGPLRVQKALYPEAPQICHAIVVHPPGGIVGGDQLQVNIQVTEQAHAVLSSPGASKWYRANGRSSAQHLQFQVADHACLEWLPQETIVYDEADIHLHCAIQLGHQARYLGCEILCLGRRWSGEKFQHGRVRQHLEIRQAGKLLWLERGTINASDALMNSHLGWQGKSVCATMVAVGQQISALQIDALRKNAHAKMNALNDDGLFGLSQIKTLTVVRYLGNSSEVARLLMMMAWHHLRPGLVGQESHDLRIWNT